MINSLFPAFGLASGSFNGLHRKSKFLAAKNRAVEFFRRLALGSTSRTRVMRPSMASAADMLAWGNSGVSVDASVQIAPGPRSRSNDCP